MARTFSEQLAARLEASPSDAILEGASVKASPFSVDDLRKETGHDDGFLGDGTAVPFPAPAKPDDRVAVGQGLITRLDYRHFSILFDLRRKQALCAMVDIDGRNWKRVKRRAGDIWYPDPRLSPLDQPQKKHFSKPDPRFDPEKNYFACGHLVRRLDPCWAAEGDTETVELAERETFFLSNASPQAEEVNTVTWNNLEDLVLNDLVQHLSIRACVMTGPIFDDVKRPLLQGDMPVPAQYFKIVAWRSEGRLAAVGWVQDQSDGVLPPALESANPFEEIGKAGQKKPSLMWLRPIKDIAERAGLDLTAYVVADTYALRVPKEGLESVFAEFSPSIANANDLLATRVLPLDDRDAANPTIAATEALLAQREREAPDDDGGGAIAESVGVSDDDAAAKVSQRAYKLIVEYETGGRDYYEQHYRKRACWPKGASGITIGFGYDLGYVTLDEFQRDWAALPADDRALLAANLGKTGAKNSAAEMTAALASVKGIVIEWEAAEAVFRARTLPKFSGKTWRALPNCALLSGDCFGALVSLAFNRGAAFSRVPKPGETDRWMQMRAIKAHMQSREFAKIPQDYLDMIPLWAGTDIATGMKRRRIDEARLFQQGLAASEPAAPESVARIEVVGVEPPDDAELFGDETEEESIARAQSAAVASESLDSPKWAADDDSPDYAHLVPLATPGGVFAFTAADLAWLAQLNDFDLEPSDKPILFGLRGALIVSDHESAHGVVLKDVRPDHLSARCTMGAWNKATAAIAVYPGSTVPNASALRSWRDKRNMGNILATGGYGYVTGVHNGKPGCFVLRDSSGAKRRVVVRRSDDDLCYELSDRVDPCAPGDNLHPTFFQSLSAFSSVGCQVVVGSATPAGAHSGPWAKFRVTAGLPQPDGVPYRYLLLTGAEARLASRARLEGLTDDPVTRRNLRRLRFGSRGAAVKALQARLGLVNPDGDFGPSTSVRLHDFQRAFPGSRGSDGVFTPALDAALGWGVFGAAIG